jgi:hypothetical protein
MPPDLKKKLYIQFAVLLALLLKLPDLLLKF